VPVKKEIYIYAWKVIGFKLKNIVASCKQIHVARTNKRRKLSKFSSYAPPKIKNNSFSINFFENYVILPKNCHLPRIQYFYDFK
jgi:hypothetical protein